MSAASTEASGIPLFLIMLTTMLGLVMSIIDQSIVNVAINNMAGSLGASVDEVAWVATGYILAQVVVMPLNGWLTARFGRRNFYAACILIFTIASFLCGTATSVWQLVAYRVVQGLGGGALQPTAQAIMFESYPPEKRANAMAIFGMAAIAGPAFGPTLGGVLIDNYSWPLIFFINIPIGIAAFFMTLAFIKDQSYVKRSTNPVDWLGLGLLTAGVASLQFVLERGQREDWFSSQSIVVAATVAVFATAAFIIRQLRDPQPLVDLRVFKSWSFTAGNIIGVVTGFGVYGTSLMLPLYFQNVLKFDATTTGLALVPGALGSGVSMLFAGRLAKWVDGRISIACGLAGFAIGSWMMAGLNMDAGFGDTLWPRMIQGFSLGFVFVPLSTATLGEISRAQMANAPGLFTLLRQLGGSLGIAILQVAETRRQDSAYATLASGATLANQNVANVMHGVANQAAMLNTLFSAVMLNAETIAYNDTFRLCAIVFVLSMPSVLLMRPSRAHRDAPVELVE